MRGPECSLSHSHIHTYTCFDKINGKQVCKHMYRVFQNDLPPSAAKSTNAIEINQLYYKRNHALKNFSRNKGCSDEILRFSQKHRIFHNNDILGENCI